MTASNSFIGKVATLHRFGPFGSREHARMLITFWVGTRGLASRLWRGWGVGDLRPLQTPDLGVFSSPTSDFMLSAKTSKENKEE